MSDAMKEWMGKIAESVNTPPTGNYASICAEWMREAVEMLKSVETVEMDREHCGCPCCNAYLKAGDAASGVGVVHTDDCTLVRLIRTCPVKGW